MVITVEGYNQKKNNSPFVAAALSSMLAMAADRKVLAINLIESDPWNIERIVMGLGKHSDMNESDMSFADEGIDQLLREADTRKLMKAQFGAYTTPVLKMENRFDIATCTRNHLFFTTIKERKMALQRVIENALEIYEDVIILLPSNSEEVCELVKNMTKDVVDIESNTTTSKPLVDTSIVCIRQGFNKVYDATGNNLIYLVTDYEDKSKYVLANITKEFISQGLINTSKTKVMKLSRSLQAIDAAREGTIRKFVKENREANKDDVNYNWTVDMLALVGKVTGEKVDEIRYDFEEAEYFDRPQQSFEEDIPEVETVELYDEEPVVEEDAEVAETTSLHLGKPINTPKPMAMSWSEKRAMAKQKKAEEKLRREQEEKAAREEAERLRAEQERIEREAREAEERRLKEEAERRKKQEAAEEARRIADEKKAQLKALMAEVEAAENDAEAKESEIGVSAITPVEPLYRDASDLAVGE